MTCCSCWPHTAAALSGKGIINRHKDTSAEVSFLFYVFAAKTQIGKLSIDFISVFQYD